MFHHSRFSPIPSGWGLALVTVLVLVAGLAGCARYQGIENSASILSVEEIGYLESMQRNQLDEGAAGLWPNDKWWLSFEDPQLSQLIAEALEKSPTMAEVAARVRLASAQLENAQSRTLPAVDLLAGINAEHYSENGMTPSPFAGSFQRSGDLLLEASYQLDFWGKNRALVAAGKYRLAAAQAEAASVSLLLADAVAQAYFELAQWQGFKGVALHAFEQRKRIVELTRQRVEAGLDNRVALRQAETQVPLTLALLAQVEEMIAISGHALSALVGSGPDRAKALDEMVATLPVKEFQLPGNLPLELMGRRPDLVAARWQVESEWQQIDAGKAEFYPNINLGAFAGFSSIGLDNLTKGGSRTYGVGPALSLPVFDGNRLRAELKGDYARLDQRIAIYNQRLIEAFHDVADQITHYRALQPQIEQQQLAYGFAQKALDLALERYEAGLGTYLTVLNAESVVIQQKLYSIQLRQRALSVQADLFRSLGGGFSLDIAEGEIQTMNGLALTPSKFGVNND